MLTKKEMWPVMLTPFTERGEVDYNALERLIAFYEEGGCSGLFAICQSSEAFYLSLEERVKIADFVKKHAHVPVIASGHASDGREAQLEELRRVTDTGVDAVILITNRLARNGEDPRVWMDNLMYLVDHLDPAMPLGFYESPAPYKRLMSLEELKTCAETGRFHFMKDTCCDIATPGRAWKFCAEQTCACTTPIPPPCWIPCGQGPRASPASWPASIRNCMPGC